MWFSDTNYHNNDGDGGTAVDFVYGCVSRYNSTWGGIFHVNDVGPLSVEVGSPK